MSGPGRCSDCPKRAGCRSLCSPAEKYVNQDYKRLRIGAQRVVRLDPDLLSPLAEQNRALSEVMVDEVLLGRMEWDMISGCGLSLRERQCLFLFAWGRKTARETARLLGLSRGSVARYLRRGRDKIKKLSYMKAVVEGDERPV